MDRKRRSARAGYEVDFLYEPQHLVVEFDSSTFHATRSVVERDRRKDAALRLKGYTVLRLTWHQVTERPESVAAAVAVALNG